MINRYFTPSDYNEDGFMNFITTSQNAWKLSFLSKLSFYIYIYQNKVSYYDFPIFDLSHIKVIDFGTTLYTYTADDKTWQYVDRDDDDVLFSFRVL